MSVFSTAWLPSRQGDVIVAPMTSKGRDYPTRGSCVFRGTKGRIVLDQIRTVDRKRVIKILGVISQKSQGNVMDVLGDMFSL